MINLKTKHEIELMATAGRLRNSVITEMRAAVSPPVTTGHPGRLAEHLLRHGRPAPVERMGDRHVRMNEPDAAGRKVDRPEEWRGKRQRQDG